MSDYFINIVAILEYSKKSKNNKTLDGKKMLTTLDQFIILYHSIRKNWYFPFKIWLFYNMELPSEWNYILRQLDVHVLRVVDDLRINALKYKMGGTHKLIINCNCIALKNPKLNMDADVSVMYGCYNYSNWTRLCKYLKCKIPKQKNKYRTKTNRWHDKMITYYHTQKRY